VQAEGCKARNVLADTWNANAKQEKFMHPLQRYTPVSPLDSADGCLGASMLPVEQMAAPRVSDREASLNQHITLLRRVEQVRKLSTAFLGPSIG
jgi:hypothetical protein